MWNRGVGTSSTFHLAVPEQLPLSPPRGGGEPRGFRGPGGHQLRPGPEPRRRVTRATPRRQRAGLSRRQAGHEGGRGEHSAAAVEAKKADIFKRAEQYVQEYVAQEKDLIRLKREARQERVPRPGGGQAAVRCGSMTRSQVSDRHRACSRRAPHAAPIGARHVVRRLHTVARNAELVGVEESSARVFGPGLPDRPPPPPDTCQDRELLPDSEAGSPTTARVRNGWVRARDRSGNRSRASLRARHRLSFSPPGAAPPILLHHPRPDEQKFTAAPRERGASV